VAQWRTGVGTDAVGAQPAAAARLDEHAVRGVALQPYGMQAATMRVEAAPIPYAYVTHHGEGVLGDYGSSLLRTSSSLARMSGAPSRSMRTPHPAHSRATLFWYRPLPPGPTRTPSAPQPRSLLPATWFGPGSELGSHLGGGGSEREVTAWCRREVRAWCVLHLRLRTSGDIDAGAGAPLDLVLLDEALRVVGEAHPHPTAEDAVALECEAGRAGLVRE